MDLLNRRSLLGFLLAASISVLQGTSAVSVAQEPVPTETAVPPTAILPWKCDWSVTCINAAGDEVTTTGTEYGVTAYRAEARAESATYGPLECCVAQTPPSIYPIITVGPAEKTGGFAISENSDPVVSCPSACQDSENGDWVVYFECTGRKGGSVSKSARGTTYCEALTNAREYVCRMINLDAFGGSCRCCSRVVARPVCYQYCVPRRKR
jgi:hypothetical protein